MVLNDSCLPGQADRIDHTVLIARVVNSNTHTSLKFPALTDDYNPSTIIWKIANQFIISSAAIFGMLYTT